MYRLPTYSRKTDLKKLVSAFTNSAIRPYEGENMFPAILAQSALYGRLTIGNSIDVAVSDVDTNFELERQGLWRIVNIGVNPAYCKMTKTGGAAQAATVSDALMTTIATSPELAVCLVEVGMSDVKKHDVGEHFLRAICEPGKTTVLRCTCMTKR